jgi:hypothetical protein
MDDAYVKVKDPSLVAIGAERLFQRHLPEIVRALLEQEKGDRVDGDCVLTMKVEIGKRGDGVRYQCKATLKSPGYAGKAASGHLVYDSDGPGRLRVLDQATQGTLLPGLRRDDDDHDAAH